MSVEPCGPVVAEHRPMRTQGDRKQEDLVKTSVAGGRARGIRDEGGELGAAGIKGDREGGKAVAEGVGQSVAHDERAAGAGGDRAREVVGVPRLQVAPRGSAGPRPDVSAVFQG